MSNIITETRMNRAILMAQDYLFNEDFEQGQNTAILKDSLNKIEIDVEVRCEGNIHYDSGNYMTPPSCSGKLTNEPVSVVAWFFDHNDDNPIEKDITNMIKAHSYNC